MVWPPQHQGKWVQKYVCYRQSSKLTLANSQNASYFDVRKISISKRLQGSVIHVSRTFVESCWKARRNVCTKSEANKKADAAEKSTFFSHSRLQSSSAHLRDCWPTILHQGPVTHLCICVLLLSLVVLKLSFSLHMSKITSFLKRPSTSDMSVRGDEDLESLKNKSLKSESKRDDTVYLKTLLHWQKDITLDLGYKVVEGRNELVEGIWCQMPFSLNFFQLINRLWEISIIILLFISDMVIDISKGKNLLVVSPVC